MENILIIGNISLDYFSYVAIFGQLREILGDLGTLEPGT
jgi:hypothetical protein